MTLRKLVLAASLAFAPVLMLAQGAQSQGGLDPASLLKPLGESWPTYSGDYTGRRYSALAQVNQQTVKNLTLAWMTRVTGGPGNAGGGGGGRGGGRGASPTIIGGEGPGDIPGGTGANIKGAVLQVDGVLYLCAPGNAWALLKNSPDIRRVPSPKSTAAGCRESFA